jgi:hypothetical protein
MNISALAAICFLFGFVEPLLAAADGCLKYSESVSLRGVVAEETFTDLAEPETFQFLNLEKPICMSQGDKEFELAISAISTIQLCAHTQN